MTTQTKIIIGIVGLAVIGGAYYFYKKRKVTADIPKVDIPKVDIPKVPLTPEQIKVIQGLPDFTKI